MPKIIFYSLFIICLCIGNSAFAKDTAPTPDTSSDAAYLTLADKSFIDANSVDWVELRKLYVASSFYHPYAMPFEKLREAWEKVGTDKTPEAMAAFETLRRQHAGHFRAHSFGLMLCEKEKPAVINCANEVTSFKKIIGTVLATGDGKSPETAIKVITTEEEYLLMRTYFKAKVTNQSLLQENGHTYDVLSFDDQVQGKKGQLYFNVDTLFAHPL